MRSALVTGVNGQDGSYLAELLLSKGYRVIGLVRRTAAENPYSRVNHLLPRLKLVEGDLLDAGSLIRALELAEPDEVYNLAAQSFVGVSFREPVATADITGVGTLRLLEAVRQVAPHARFYQASSSEMFGNVAAPQNEISPFRPRSPYAVAKLFAHASCITYRESYGMYVACGILFNHESPRRGAEFVTRKISLAVAAIARQEQRTLTLGSLDARRDWGWAPEYVDVMHRMLQMDRPEDFVVGTGVAHSVKDFCQAAFEAAGLDWREHVVQDPELMRPAEVFDLRADSSKARELLNWEPSMDLKDIASAMVRHDLGLSQETAGGPVWPRGLAR